MGSAAPEIIFVLIYALLPVQRGIAKECPDFSPVGPTAGPPGIITLSDSSRARVHDMYTLQHDMYTE